MTSSQEWPAWNLPYLTDLGLHLEGVLPPNFIAFVRFLCRCRMSRLSVLQLEMPTLSLHESPIVVGFFRAHPFLWRCKLSCSGDDVAEVLPHVSSTHLRLLDRLEDIPLVPLHPRVRTFSYEYTLPLRIDPEDEEDTSIFHALDAFNAQDRARNGLVHLQLCIRVRWLDHPGIASPFRWLNPGQGIADFVERVRVATLRIAAA
jgi:hypothetical protein